MRETKKSLLDSYVEYCPGLCVVHKCDANMDMEVSKLPHFLLWSQQCVWLFWVNENKKLSSLNPRIAVFGRDLWTILSVSCCVPFLCSEQVPQDWIQSVVLLFVSLGSAFSIWKLKKVDLFDGFCLVCFEGDVSTSFLFQRPFCVHELKNVPCLCQACCSLLIFKATTSCMCAKRFYWKKTHKAASNPVKPMNDSTTAPAWKALRAASRLMLNLPPK